MAFQAKYHKSDYETKKQIQNLSSAEQKELIKKWKHTLSQRKYQLKLAYQKGKINEYAYKRGVKVIEEGLETASKHKYNYKIIEDLSRPYFNKYMTTITGLKNYYQNTMLETVRILSDVFGVPDIIIDNLTDEEKRELLQVLSNFENQGAYGYDSTEFRDVFEYTWKDLSFKGNAQDTIEKIRSILNDDTTNKTEKWEDLNRTFNMPDPLDIELDLI